MNRPLVRRVALLAALIALGVAQRSPLAAPPPPDPWAKVPAFPSGCYLSDGFAEKLAAADEAVSRDLERQKSINTQISEELKSIDAMELASRQQKYMMANPQKAMELMQRNQQLGQDSAAIATADAENVMKLQKELEGIDARYRASLDATLTPLTAKFKDLDVRAGKDTSILTEAGTYTGWALKEYNGLIAQENTGYEKVCSEYWAASGPFHGWLKRYGDLVKGQIPHREEADAVGAGFVVMMISTPEKSWQSTATLSAVNDYMDQAAKVFARRRLEPRAAAK